MSMSFSHLRGNVYTKFHSRDSGWQDGKEHKYGEVSKEILLPTYTNFKDGDSSVK